MKSESENVSGETQLGALAYPSLSPQGKGPSLLGVP